MTRRISLILVAVLLMVPLSACQFSDYTWSAAAERQVRQDLSARFPGSRLVELKGQNQWPWAGGFDGRQLNSFLFEMQSERTPRFRVAGRYYVKRNQAIKEEQRAFRRSMFSGPSPSPQQLQALERQFISIAPTAVVLAGMDDATGNVEGNNWLTMSAKYEGMSLRDVYCLESPGAVYFFRLNRESGTWQYLPDLSEY